MEVASFDGFNYATRDKNETAMMVYMYNNAPLAICVDAITWQLYIGGIIKKKYVVLLSRIWPMDIRV